MSGPFVVLEVACPLRQTWSIRWEATLGRGGKPELLVVASGALNVPPLHVLAPGTDVAVLSGLDVQAAEWVAENGGDTDRYVAHLVAEWLAEH